jgi:DNA-directed RNA polymerase subunit RPC12/RpoP
MGIVKPRHAYYGGENICKKCAVFLRRLYVRDIYYEDAEGKRHERVDTYGLKQKRNFAPLAWWCPSCDKTTYDCKENKASKDKPQDSPAVQCRECKSTNTVFRKERGRSKQYQCRDCSAYFSIKDNETENNAETCPECGVKVSNPDSLSELTCQGCGEQFAC